MTVLRTTLLGYVVVEFNQASGLPKVDSYSGFGGDIYDRPEADEILACTRAETAAGLRRETYALAELRLVEESR